MILKDKVSYYTVLAASGNQHELLTENLDLAPAVMQRFESNMHAAHLAERLTKLVGLIVTATFLNLLGLPLYSYAFPALASSAVIIPTCIGISLIALVVFARYLVVRYQMDPDIRRFNELRYELKLGDPFVVELHCEEKNASPLKLQSLIVLHPSH